MIKFKNIVEISKKKFEKMIEFTMNNWYSIFGQKQYEKFIVITSARTGSGLLISLLNNHENIEARGELYRSLEGKTSIDRWNQIFNFKNKNIYTAGFKIFYFHPFDKKNSEVWNIIKQDKSIKIIHLIRENKIRSYVSLKIAEKTDKWTRKSKTQISLKEKQINVDLKDFKRRIDAIEMKESKISLEYNDHPFFELSYEDLVNNKNKVMSELFKFLGVEEWETKSNYKKQNKEKLEDIILNYKEFKDLLENSKYSSFLE